MHKSKDGAEKAVQCRTEVDKDSQSSNRKADEQSNSRATHLSQGDTQSRQTPSKEEDAAKSGKRSH